MLGAAFYRGSGSQYEMQKETLLSAGVLVPCLRKLKDAGLITVEKPGRRERRQISITTAGRSVLEEQWRKALDENISDFEAVLKLCKVGEWISLEEAIGFCQRAVEFRSKQLSFYERPDKVREAPILDSYSLASYRELAKFHRLQGEEIVLRALKKALIDD